jgi:hypothetical protein
LAANRKLPETIWGTGMSFSLFGWTFGQPPDARSGAAAPPQPAANDAHGAGNAKVCPPCTGCCYQGRACPQSARADATLISWMRRSTPR